MADQRGVIIERGLNATHRNTHQHIRFQDRHGGEAGFNLGARSSAQRRVENATANRMINAEALLDGGIGQAKLEANNIPQRLGENRDKLVLHAAPIGG